MAAAWIRYIIARLPVGVVRIILNRWRPFWGAGIQVDRITPDYREIDASLHLRWYNRNYVGVHFGGSIFAMTDAFYVIILMKNLGTGYIVWDKSAKIDYKKPGRGTLKAVFCFSGEEIAAIREQTDRQGKYIFDKAVDVTNEAGEVVAAVVKTIYVRKK